MKLYCRAFFAVFGIGLSLLIQNTNSLENNDAADIIRNLDSTVLTKKQRKDFSSIVRSNLRSRIQEANDWSSATWNSINNREDWERFRDAKLQALKNSLGRFPEPSEDLNVHVTRSLAGDGFQIENLIYESRAGLWVTANLYLPIRYRGSIPGIIICHSHHAPKTQGELQDIGMTWARQGCAVLVMDQLGHGERRQHPFRTTGDYEHPYRIGRQDYYFRYDTGIQLHLAGDSLMGWMVWDLMRGVDLLLERSDIDPKRIILLGAVAGGGDPTAVAGAIDSRIAGVVPFNFGGPQPETQYPLPEDVETSLNYAGSGSWESTRNLRYSAVDGFLPWVIVGSISPRSLVYAHEFSWNRERDPVWKRLNQIYGFYNESKNLSFAHGYGVLQQSSSEASHCTNIGAFHREFIHTAFQQWFNISITSEDEYSNRYKEEDLLSMTPEVEKEIEPKRLIDLLPEIAMERAAPVRKLLDDASPAVKCKLLRDQWTLLLGNLDPNGSPNVLSINTDVVSNLNIRVDRVVLEVETGIVVPLMILLPKQEEDKQFPLVIAVSQSGKEGFLRHRANDIVDLLNGGIAVCLPDVRGTGETNSSQSRDFRAIDSSLSSSELMLGGTMAGSRLRDLRSVLRYLSTRNDIISYRMAFWGDSFALVNPQDTNFNIPREVDTRPGHSEPIGGLLALLGALFENNIHAVYIHGGLSGFQSVLTNQFVYIPHDVVIPGVLTAGDLCDIAAVLAPRPLCLEGLVDELNRRLSLEVTRTIYKSTLENYHRMQAGDHVSIHETITSPAHWLIDQFHAQ